MKPIQKFSRFARLIVSVAVSLLPGLLLVRPVVAQTAGAAASASTPASISISTPVSAGAPLPHFVRFNGTAKDLNGSPLTGAVGITFALYAEPTGGAPLWLETQNVQADSNGHYNVLLGFTKPDGLPAELFTSEEARWVGVQVSGQAEQPRVLLVPVPYAMKAVDAESLGGRPASAYALVAPAATSGTANKTAASSAGATTMPGKASSALPAGSVTGTGVTNFVPLWTSQANLGDSLIFQLGTRVGINTTTPGATLSVKGNGTFFANSNTQALEVTQSGGTGSGIIASTNSTGGIGIEGTSSSTANSPLGGIGVYGFSSNPSGSGVEGTSGNIGVMGNGGSIGGSTGTGVQGNGNQYGLYGSTNDSLFPAYQVGVYGTTSSASATAYGVEGIASSTTGTPVGVYGLSSSPSGYGIEGVSGNIGVYGNAGASTSGHGVEGVSANVGVLGSGTGSAGIGVDGHGAIGIKGVATTGGLAGLFQGPLLGEGNANYTVIGDPGCGGGYAGLGFLPSGSLSGCTNYALLGGANGGTYINSHGTGAINFRNKNNQLASIDSAGNLTVIGQTASNSLVGQSLDVGVYGSSGGASTRGANFGFAGVWGDTAGVPNYAVLGTADGGYGGVFENKGDHATLYAQNNSSTGALVFWALGSGGAGCTIDTSGNLVCNGNITGASAVDGGARKVALYAVQSPENWFEDFGSGALSNGAATIKLDPTFAQTVNTGTEYHVFLTPNGDSKGLYVSQKTGTSFEVREQGGGHSSIAFDYRIVAKRVGYEKIRLADLTEQFNRQEAQRENMRRPVRPSAALQVSPVAPQPSARAAAHAVIQAVTAQPE